MGTATIQKHEHLAASCLPTHDRTYQSTKSIKGFSHIAMTVKKIEFMGATQ
ncbi:hypothetical protein FM120_20830 [Sphingobacterium faecium PCAi_F2.5]|nr:hypothetical protein FM120_20830 [Sphingobacterium faecium PCAi_F2.5]